MSGRPDRREFPRVPLDLRVDLYSSQQSLRACRTRDISRQGLFVETDNPLNVGTVCCADLWLEGAEPPIAVALRVRVAQQRCDGMGLRMLGFQDRNSYEHLLQLVAYNYLSLEKCE